MARTPSGTQVAVATAFANPLTFTAITNATEAVLTVTGATLAAGDYVEVTSGWGRLSNRVFRLKNASATSLTLEGCDTTNTTLFPTGLGAGSVRKVNTWVGVTNPMNLAFSGGEAKAVNFTYLDAEDEQTIFDGVTAITYTLDIDADNVGTPSYNALKALSDSQTVTAMRLTAKTGAQVLVSATCFLSETPTMQSGSAMVNKVTFYGRGRVVRYAS